MEFQSATNCQGLLNVTPERFFSHLTRAPTNGATDSTRKDVLCWEHIAMPKRPQSKPVKKKNPAAVALSKLGASKGGAARAKKLSAERRSQIARRAAAARWEQTDAR